VLEAFGHAGDADVFFDDVVVGGDVCVADGPVFAVAVVRGGFEILIAEAEADAAPDVGAAAGDAEAAHPVEGLVGGRGVRFVVIVDEPVLRVFVADVEFALDRVILFDDGIRHVAIFQFEGGFVLGEIFVGLRATGFDDGDVEAGFGEALCGPAAGGAGADYEDVKICWRVGSGHLRERRDRRGSDAGFYGKDANKRDGSRQRKKMDFSSAKILLDVGGEWYHRRRKLKFLLTVEG